MLNGEKVYERSRLFAIDDIENGDEMFVTVVIKRKRDEGDWNDDEESGTD